MAPQIEDEDTPEGYYWTNKLVTTVRDDPNPRQSSRIAHLFVGEWVKKLDEDNGITHIKFRGGEGYVSSQDLGSEKLLEIYFLDVGQGDAILVQTADNKRVLIDGGPDKSAHSFLQWKYNLAEHSKVFDAIIMSHGDSDHSKGLIRVLKDTKVIPKAVYHNGIAKRSRSDLGEVVTTPDGKMLKDLYDTPESLEGVQLTRLYRDWCDVVSKASKRTQSKGYEFSCIRADSATDPLEIGDMKINFANPVNKGTETEPLLHKFGSAGKTINGNSVGVKIEYGKASILLCGDMNPPSEKVLLASCRDDALYSHVFKANHHGSHHFTTEFLDAINPWVTVVSSGDVPDYGHPRANLMGSLGHYAPDEIKEPLLFSTELAATFKKIPESKQKDKGTQLYEKNTQGIIYVRTNGDWLATGRIFKKKDYDEGMIKSSWKWEAYAYDLESGRFLLNDLETYKS